MTAAFAWLAVVVALSSATASASSCPDFDSPRCLEEIRAAIDRHDFNQARDAAESQCWSKPTEGAESLTPVALATVASGCYQLYVIERFLDQPLNAVNARDKAQRIATWGCERGVDDLCEVLLGLMQRRTIELIAEFAADAAYQDSFYRGFALRNVRGARIMPSSLLGETRQSLHEKLGARLNQKIGDCVSCTPAAAAKDRGGDGSQPPYVLDVDLNIDGGEIRLDARMYETNDYRLVFERSYRTRDMAERQKLFGFAALESTAMVEYRRIEAYQPIYRFSFGLGSARIPNLAGNDRDAARMALHARATELFHERRSEFGLMLSYHVTRRTLEGMVTDRKSKDTAAAASADDDPDVKEAYPTAMSLYAIYNRMLFNGRESFDTIRHSLGGGCGILMSSAIIAPTVRLSWDMYLGRRYYTSLAGVIVGATTLVLEDSGKMSKTVTGGELTVGMTW